MSRGPNTREFVEQILTIDESDLTPEVLRAVRILLLDHLGVAANGSTTESAAVMRSSNRWFEQVDGPRLSIVGTGQDAPALRAAMCNAFAAHSTEYDDVHNASSSHPGVAVIPAALAAAALARADADSVVRGIVVGYEVMCRIGRAANPPSHYARNFHPTGTSGSFGAAAAAAVVMGLDADAAVAALGIVGSMASGSMQFLVDGAWTKRLHPALAVRNGVEAALLAADGFVGTLDGVNGERGFLSAYSAEPHSEELLADWGSRPLEVIATSIKAHTCCRYNQGGIDAVLALRSAHGLSPDEVVRVTVGVPSVAVGIVLEPADAKRRPTSVVDAQFSLPYGVAVALRHGAAGTVEYADEVITDPDTAAVMDRVSYRIDPDIDAAYPRQWKAWAEIETSGGDVLRHDIDEPKGDPGNPLDEAELETKFRTLCASAVSGAVIDRVVDVVGRFGELGTFGELERAW